jgi:diketogulonate reductase-like aldo/keto reductase
MAYSPLKFLAHLDPHDPRYQVLQQLAAKRQVEPATVALAYLLDAGPVIAIPKAISKAHIDANCQALTLELSADERHALKAQFPVPSEDLPFQAL